VDFKVFSEMVKTRPSKKWTLEFSEVQILDTHNFDMTSNNLFAAK